MRWRLRIFNLSLLSGEADCVLARCVCSAKSTAFDIRTASSWWQREQILSAFIRWYVLNAFIFMTCHFYKRYSFVVYFCFGALKLNLLTHFSFIKVKQVFNVRINVQESFCVCSLSAAGFAIYHRLAIQFLFL